MGATAAHEREEEDLFEFSEVFRQCFVSRGREVLHCSFGRDLSSRRSPATTPNREISRVRSLLLRSLPGPIGSGL